MKAARTHKSEKISRLLPRVSDSVWPAHYLSYFACFDRELYYEAHDVLEELWLGSKNEEPYQFFKGLIQLAGSFVHIQKKRSAPAVRLYEVAWKNLTPYGPKYWGLDMQRLKKTLSPYYQVLTSASGNPLTTLGPPQITHCFCHEQTSKKINPHKDDSTRTIQTG